MKSVGLFFVTALLLLSIGQGNAVSETTAQPESIPNELHRSEHLETLPYIEFDQSPFRYDSAGLDSFILAACSTLHFPGVATWCSKNGQVVWQRSYRYANLQDSIAVTDTTSFLLASISKTFTTTAIMQLWERGLFNLDDDLNDYLSFSIRNPYYPDSAITFRMLMTHTSSIHDNWSMLPLWVPGDHPMPLGDFVQEYLVPGGIYYSTANFNNTVPGVSYDYCNAAIALLGYLVEAIEDSLPIHCRDSIFIPLEMNHTSWFLSNLDTNNVAARYQWTGTNYVRYPHSGCAFYPAAQLRASSVDIARHLTAIQQYGVIDTVRILDSATVSLIISQQFVGPGFIQGLTWRYLNLYGRWIWYHGGGMTGVSTIYGFCPAENSAIVVLINRGSSSVETYPIADALFDFAAQLAVDEQSVPKPIEPSKNLAATIFRGLLHLPEGKKCKVFDIIGRVVEPSKIRPGIYFIEVDGVVTQKVVKVR